MSNKLFLLMSIVGLAFTACKKDFDPQSLNCDKLKTYEEATALMQDIRMNRMEALAEIKTNLIGEWGLIGIAPGWFGFEAGEECIRLIIDEDAILLQDMSSGKESKISYKIMSFEANGKFHHYLDTDEHELKGKIEMKEFSQNYMYGTAFALDVDQYIYEKIN